MKKAIFMNSKAIAIIAAILALTVAVVAFVPTEEADAADVQITAEEISPGYVAIYVPTEKLNDAVEVVITDATGTEIYNRPNQVMSSDAGAIILCNVEGYTDNCTVTVTFSNGDVGNIVPAVDPDTPYHITISEVTNGTVEVTNADGIVTEETDLIGEQILTVTVTPNTGVDVESVTVNGIMATEQDGTYVATMTVTENTVITAIINEVESTPVPGEDIIYNEDTTVTYSVLNGNVTVNPGVTVTFTGDVTVNGNMYLYGNLVYDGTGEMTITVADQKTFKAFSGAAIQQDITVVSGGEDTVIDIADAMEIMDINNNVTSSNTYSQTQIVVITETLNLRTGTTTTILGQLQVDEGVILTIESGATLVIDSETAKMIVDGSIEVEEGARILVNEADDVTVSGEIVSNGLVYIDSTVTVQNGGSIVVDDAENSEIEVLQGLTVENGGVLEIMGQAIVADITNKGTVTFDGAVLAGNVKISQAADGAVVDIRSFTSDSTARTLTVTDDGLVFRAATSSTKAVVVTEPNTLTVTGKAFGGVSNLTITQSVTSETENRVTTYYNHMVLAGSVAIADESLEDADEVTSMDIQVSGPSIDVAETLTIGRGVTVTLTDGVMNVTGTVTAVAEGSKLAAGDSHSDNIDVNVTGTVTVRDEIRFNINAFEYETEAEGYTNHIYTTLADAIDAAATTIYAYGDVKVLDTVTIPAGTQVRPGNDAGMITIGDEDNRDVTVTVAADGEIRSCFIDVMGTLYFEDSRDQRNCTIYSDVSVFTEPSARYTNIYTALAGAQSGETVTISRSNGAVVLDRDVSVGEGVTLEIPGTRTLQLNDGVTLTVDGTVRNSGTVAAQTDFAIEAANTAEEKASAIVVNGLFMQMNEIAYTDYYIAGAYYNLINAAGNWNYVAPVDTAASVSNDVTDGAIAIYGENAITEVTFTGDENQPVYVAVVGGTDTYDAAVLIADNINLVYAQIDVEGIYDGAVSTAIGSVDIVNATGFTVSDVYVDETEVMTIAGQPTVGDIDGADPAVTIASGVVTVIGTLNLNNMSGTIDEKKFEGSFTVSAGAELIASGIGAQIIADALSVDGTLTAYDGGLVDVSILTVNGTFTVSPADVENNIAAGQADVQTLYVGIDSEFGAGAAATVNADSIRGLTGMYVSADSTVGERLIDGMRYSTEFYIEDALWMTAYANAGHQSSLSGIVPSELVNSTFTAPWQYDNNGTLTDAAGNAVVGTYPAVYANLKYDIYEVTIFADPGIDAIYIDGQLMTSGMFTEDINGMMAQGFRAYVTAGTHEITYKLGSYYSGEAQMTVNGTAVSGNTITTSGTPENGDSYVTYTVYLQGIQADTPVTPEQSSGDDGLGLTDYLLIILVVLIVIMAIIVALRLMRS